MQQRTQIAYVLDSFRLGGSELNAVRVAEKFALQVFVFRDDGPLRTRYEALGVTISVVPIRSLFSFTTIGLGLSLARRIREAGIDVVHTHCVYSNIFAIPYARMFTRARVIGSRRWGRDVFPVKFNIANKLALKFAHAVLGNSKRVGELLQQADAVPTEKIRVIPNFVDDGLFEKSSRPTPLREQWSIGDDRPIVGILARLHPVKNHEMLIRAFAPISDTAWLVVAGGGERGDLLQGLVNDLGISERVRFLGEQAPDLRVQEGFDISVLTSFDEGFPNSVIEAMASGKPVVATRVGGVPDAVVEGETGFLIAAGDEDALTKSLTELIASPSLRRSMGDAGRELARARFSRAAIVSALENLYSEQLHSRTPVVAA